MRLIIQTIQLFEHPLFQEKWSIIVFQHLNPHIWNYYSNIRTPTPCGGTTRNIWNSQYTKVTLFTVTTGSWYVTSLVLAHHFHKLPCEQNTTYMSRADQDHATVLCWVGRSILFSFSWMGLENYHVTLCRIHFKFVVQESRVQLAINEWVWLESWICTEWLHASKSWIPTVHAKSDH